MSQPTFSIDKEEGYYFELEKFPGIFKIPVISLSLMKEEERYCRLSYHDEKFFNLAQYDPKNHFGLKTWSENEEIASSLIKQGLVKIEFVGQIQGIQYANSGCSDVLASLTDKGKNYLR